jgi:hypothetical protein
VACLVARKNILAARRSATKIRGGATMVASCERALIHHRQNIVKNLLSVFRSPNALKAIETGVRIWVGDHLGSPVSDWILMYSTITTPEKKKTFDNFYLPTVLTGRIPDEVEFFNLPNPSSRTMALGSTQPLTEMSTRNLPGGRKRPARRADNLAAIYDPNV